MILSQGENRFMRNYFISICVCAVLISSPDLSPSGILAAGDQAAAHPFKVLLIIGDQWRDPMSYMIGDDCSSEFKQTTILLKSWGIPFDIIRLDQQFLDRNMFLGPDGKPTIGTIIWDVNESDNLLNPDYNIITDMVLKEGISLIALSDRIQQPEVQSLLGLTYVGVWETHDDLQISQDHFLTNNLINPLDHTDDQIHRKRRVQVSLSQDAKTLVRQGKYPQVTTKVHESGARCVWIGGDNTQMFSYQEVRTLLRRAVTWTIGYSLSKTWENRIIMKMDDPGGAQGAWLGHWHYPTLSEEEIEKYLIEPLQKHDAVLNINIVSGFVNDETRQTEPAWQRKFSDAFGTTQDYPSTKRGLDKGLALGVFQIMCHGLTHMQPDLTSAPGWWGTAPDQERAQTGWYREFADLRRGKEIPAAEQLWRMRTARKWLEYQFGVTPLEFLQGGGGLSTSYLNNTVRLAGRAGFGWYGFAYSLEGGGYLGNDMTIYSWEFSGTSDAPRFEVSRPDGHDFGITYDPQAFAKIFEEYPEGRFIGVNEYIGYLHSRHIGTFDVNSHRILIETVYDAHYCQHFATHPSTWNLSLADWLVKSADDRLQIKVDDRKPVVINDPARPQMISIPAGTGSHSIEIQI